MNNSHKADINIYLGADSGKGQRVPEPLTTKTQEPNFTLLTLGTGSNMGIFFARSTTTLLGSTTEDFS